MTLTDTDWDIRLYVYESLAEGGFAPDADAISVSFGISAEEALRALQRLHDAHALVLSPGSSDILMANPLSAAPSDYRVVVGETVLYANCAWDSLGIPAMLGADAHIEARHPSTGDLIEYGVKDDRLRGGPDCLVHFAHPFRHWYDDIVDT